MITLINTSSTREYGESVLFQPVLKVYPMHHSWLITAHLSLGHLEHHWKTFNRQMDRTHQLLQFLIQWPSAPTQLLATLQVELTNVNDIYISYKPIIIPATNLLNTDPSFDVHSNHNNCIWISLLPFLGNALSWLMGTATTKDVNDIKKRVNQLIEAQSTQQKTLVYIMSILNVMQYAAQVNRHSIMDNVDEVVHDVNNLYILTTSLVTSLSFHQLILHIRSVLVNLWDSLSYIRIVSMHIIDHVNAATVGTLLPHVLPIMDLKKMLSHIEETLPPTLHLPASAEDTLHLYIYIFTLDIHHGNFTAWYDINTQYLSITQDETMAVEMSPHEFSICQEANGWFCNVITPFQPLANPPSCITVLYSKNTHSISVRCSLQIRKTWDNSILSQLAPSVWILTTPSSAVSTTITLVCPGETSKFVTIQKPIHILWLPPACSATMPNFHLPPHYENAALEVSLSLDMANLNTINISSSDFCIWQHLKKY